MSHQVMSPTRQQSVLPFVKTLDLTQKPTHSQLDYRTTTVFSEDQRANDGVLHVGHEEYSVLMRKVKAS